jgi:type II secretory pathway pseudopilin PulG
MRRTWEISAARRQEARRLRAGTRCARGAFTILELMIAITLVSLILVAMSNSILTSMKATGVNRESGLAADGLAAMMERLQGVGHFSDVFKLYTADPTDDPGMPGTAPGPNFAVPGLQAVDGDPDGFVGEIIFPTIGNDLIENIVDPRLGMPRDLNGDGTIDNVPHNVGYKLLPVLLRIRWKGVGVQRSMEIRTLLADR